MRTLSLALCLAASLVPAVTHADSYNVGLTAIQIADPEGLRPIDVELLYPAEPGGQATRFGLNGALQQFEVHADAPAAAGSFPLVLISHGLYGMASNYGWLSTELVARGMIVANPVHPGTAWNNKGGAETAKLWQRPRDLSRVISHLAADPIWRERIDADHIAAIGHSLGGYTVLAAAGARFDAGRFGRYCDAHPERSGCAWFAAARIGADPPARASLELPAGDDRIGAVVSLDLGLAQAFDPQSLGAINIPVLVIGAGHFMAPTVLVEAESRHLASLLPESTSTYVESDRFSHFTFFSECRPGALEMLIAAGEGDEMICEDGGVQDRATLHNELIALIEGFLRDAGLLAHEAG